MKELNKSKTKKPKLKLKKEMAKQSGNPFAFLDIASRAWKDHNLPQDEWDNLYKHACNPFSGDDAYLPLLSALQKYFEVI